jgi:hypothetical protein
MSERIFFTETAEQTLEIYQEDGSDKSIYVVVGIGPLGLSYYLSDSEISKLSELFTSLEAGIAGTKKAETGKEST